MSVLWNAPQEKIFKQGRSCYCHDCLLETGNHCANSEWVDDWEELNIERNASPATTRNTQDNLFKLKVSHEPPFYTFLHLPLLCLLHPHSQTSLIAQATFPHPKHFFILICTFCGQLLFHHCGATSYGYFCFGFFFLLYVFSFHPALCTECTNTERFTLSPLSSSSLPECTSPPPAPSLLPDVPLPLPSHCLFLLKIYRHWRTLGHFTPSPSYTDTFFRLTFTY